MPDDRDPYDYEGTKPTRPKHPAVHRDERADEPTMVKCPTCAAVEVSKLGCRTCAGAGFITYEAYLTLTCKCPTCLGSGRITNDANEALEADAKRRDRKG